MPFPVVVYGNDRPTDYDFAYKQAAEFAGRGYAGLLVDAPAALDLPGYYSWDATQDVKTWVASVTDLRRGLDLLETLPQIDAARIGFEGNNLGGAMGADLAGLDQRVKAFALAYVGGTCRRSAVGTRGLRRRARSSPPRVRRLLQAHR